MENNEKRNKIIITILSIIVVIIIVIIGILLSKRYFNNNNNTSNNTENNTINNEIKIPDDLLKSFNFITQKIDNKYIISDLYTVESLKDIENIDKLYLVLEWNNKNNIKKEVTSDFINSFEGLSILPKYAINIIMDENGKYITKENENIYIEESSVENEFKKEFGIEYSSIKPLTLSRCMNYFYDKKDKVFLYRKNCGINENHKEYSYIYDYNNENDEYYIYVAVGSSSHISNDKVEKDVINNGNLNQKVYKDNATEEEMKNFKIDQNNYNEFGHFKYTFEKNSDGNYIFKSLDIVKE